MSRYPVTNLIKYDLEVYPNFFLAGFKHPAGTRYRFWLTEDNTSQIHDLRRYLAWVEDSPFELAGFNSNRYDDAVLNEVLTNPTPRHAYLVSHRIIVGDEPSWSFAQGIESIDLMQILKGRIGLKKLGVCMGHPRLQELPFDPNVPLTGEQMGVIIGYNDNDLDITDRLTGAVQEALDLREHMSEMYGVDLRSKGDATIAEVVLTKECEKLTGVSQKALKQQARESVKLTPAINVDPPTWWTHVTGLASKYPMLSRVIETGERVFRTPIGIFDYRMERGAMSDSLFLADRWYSMGVGGLHSVDGSGCWVPADDEMLLDIDVTSYYPFLMLTQNLFPRHWGPEFLTIFEDIVNQRLEAKHNGDAKIANILKIVINGTYGKTSDAFSALLDPYVTANVTVRGQLALLTLIAMLSSRGGRVVSANTDGITLLCKKAGYEALKSIVAEWEEFTRLNMEYTEYRSLWQLDVNNYIAVKTDGKLKCKGRFLTPKPGTFDLEHTPNMRVCAIAVQNYLRDATPVEETIFGCHDLQAFILTQQSTGEVEVTWNGKPLGKMVRFYKSTSPRAAPIMKYPKAGNVTANAAMVANSDRCIEVSDLPESFPEDIDYAWYIAKAKEWLQEISVPKTPHMNNLARMMQERGLTPTLVDISSKRLSRARPKTDGDIDFSSLGKHQRLGVCTGKGTGILAMRNAAGVVTNLFRVQRDYPSKTRPLVLKNEGFELIYGGNVVVDPWVVIPTPPTLPLESYYTPAELNKVN